MENIGTAIAYFVNWFLSVCDSWETTFWGTGWGPARLWDCKVPWCVLCCVLHLDLLRGLKWNLAAARFSYRNSSLTQMSEQTVQIAAHQVINKRFWNTTSCLTKIPILHISLLGLGPCRVADVWETTLLQECEISGHKLCECVWELCSSSPSYNNFIRNFRLVEDSF